MATLSHTPQALCAGSGDSLSSISRTSRAHRAMVHRCEAARGVLAALAARTMRCAPTRFELELVPISCRVCYCMIPDHEIGWLDGLSWARPTNIWPTELASLLKRSGCRFRTR